MSGNIEDEIVSMKFDNKQFESGVATSMSSLDRLKAALSFSGASTGLNDINRSVSGFNMSPMSNAIQGVSKVWLGMSTVAITAISNITTRAVDAGIKVAKAFTVDPIAAGFSNYETKINAVQTILANTADQGVKLPEVTKKLDELNTYANKTVYNFAEMAKNIGTFTAAGVDLKTSVSSIKGIANLAALSGSSSEQASSAMYQLSQAIAAGQVHLQDWNSVVNAGIGGAAFQKNLIQTALATGSLDKNQVHLGKTMADTTINGQAFRQSLTPPPGGTSWLTSKTLTTSLGTFTGDLTVAQLVAQGFQKDVAKSIVAQGKMASNAATKVKTFSQLFQALKEEVASAWSKVFEALFGNIVQAKKFLSPLHVAIENFLTKPILAVAAALASWRKAGGFDDLTKIFVDLGKIVGNLLYPFKALFGGLAPSTKDAGKGLEGFTHTIAKFADFMVKVTNGIKHFTVPFIFLRSIFTTLVHAAEPLLKIFDLFGPVFNKLSKQMGGFTDQFRLAGTHILGGILAGMDPKKMEKAVRDFANNIVIWIKDALGIHSPASTMVPVGQNIVAGIGSGLNSGAQTLITALQKLVIGMGKAVKYMVNNVDWGAVVHVINEALFVALALTFRNFIHSFTGTIDSFKHVFHSASGVLDQLTGNLKTMQQKVKSEIIRNIAISIGILAASAFILSKVDGKKLAVSLGAIAGMMITLLKVMGSFAGGAGKKGNLASSAKDTVKQAIAMDAMGAALIAFSTAVLILTSAVALMGQLKPETIKKGLAGIAGVITLIVASTAILSKTGGGATILATATAMTIMAVALVEFVGVMKLYEKLDAKTLIRGGGSAAAVIFALGLAMRGFGKGALTGSVGLVIASGALIILAKAMQEFAAIGLGDMIKSVIALGYILTLLVAATAAMSVLEGGAGALVITAAGIYILAQALKIISKIPLLDLLKALGALALTLALIAAAAILLSPAVPLIAALGISLVLFGAAILLAGLGVLAFATGMGILAVVGPAAFVALGDGIDLFVAKLPEIAKALGGFFVNMLTGFADASGPLVKAIFKIGEVILEGLGSLIPKGRKLIQKFINALFQLIVHNQANAIKAMIDFAFALLKGFSDKLPKFIKVGTDLIVNVITGLGNASVRIANATGKAILHFLNGLDKAIVKYAPQIRDAGLQLAFDMADGMTGGLLSYGIRTVKAAVEELASHIPGWAKKILGITSPSKVMRDQVGKWAAIGVADGIDQNAHHARRASEDLAHTAFKAMRDTFAKSKHGADALGDLQPKITPVLDLSQIEKGAGLISAKMGSHSVKAELSRATARDIAGEHAARHRSGGNSQGGDTYTYEQNIYSPKPVDHVKVYRGTKSLMALKKEVTSR